MRVVDHAVAGQEVFGRDAQPLMKMIPGPLAGNEELVAGQPQKPALDPVPEGGPPVPGLGKEGNPAAPEARQ